MGKRGILEENGQKKGKKYGEAEDEVRRGTGLTTHLPLLKADLTEPYWMWAVIGGLNTTLGADILWKKKKNTAGAHTGEACFELLGDYGQARGA